MSAFTRALWSWVPVAALALTLMAEGAAQAQVIVPTRPQPQDRPLVLTSYEIRIEVDDQLAQVTVDQLFTNPNDRVLEGTYLFPLPEGAAVSGLTLCHEGECVEGRLLDARRARQVYEEIVRRTLDPALLQYVGDRAFEVRVFPIPARGEKRVQLRYQQVLERRGDTIELVLPLGRDARRVALRATLRDDDPIASVFSPSLPLSVDRLDDHEVRLDFEGGGAGLRELVLYYTLAQEGGGLGFDLLAHRAPGEDGYFTVLISPVQPQAEEALPKDIVFVFDVSGSMQGEKIEQARQALRYALDHLNPDDRFALVTFSDVIQSFQGGLIRPDEVEQGALDRFIAGMQAGGSTDIHAALLRGLRYFEDDERLKLMVFLTDGLPTFGETDPARIVRDTTEANRLGVRLFVFGVGYDVNARLLDRLSIENGGVAGYVTPGESLEREVSAFYDQVGTPLLADLTLDFGDAQVQVYDLYPRRLPDLFKGGQLQLFGRYSYKTSGGPTPTRTRITLRGRQNGRIVIHTFEATLPEEETRHAFLPRIWATRKVGYLLEQIRLYGEDDELVQQVKELALRYGIVTPYTSYLASPEDEDEQATVLPAAPIPLERRALFDASGQAAVKASISLRAMSEATRPPAYHAVRSADGRTFVYREGAWRPAGLSAQRDVDLEVRFGSEAYFWLLDRFPLKEALSLGTEVIVPAGGKLIRVSADAGMTDPDELGSVLVPEITTDSSTSTQAEAGAGAGAETPHRGFPWGLAALAALAAVVVGVLAFKR